MNAFRATDEEFIAFISTLVPLEGEGLEHWTWEERRDFLNWCLDNEVLVIHEGRLIPNPTWTYYPDPASVKEEEGVGETTTAVP